MRDYLTRIDFPFTIKASALRLKMWMDVLARRDTFSAIGRAYKYEQKSHVSKANGAICEYLLVTRELRSSGAARKAFIVWWCPQSKHVCLL